MKISITIPVYNRKDMLRECIETFIAQTFKDFELIVVDQGSDIDPEVFNNYALNIKYIKVDLEKAGYKDLRNPAYAQNVGIKHSQGEYLIFTSPEVVLENQGLNNISIIMNHKMFLYCGCKECSYEVMNLPEPILYSHQFLSNLPQIRWLCHSIERKEELAYFYGVVHNKVVREIQGLDEDYMVAVGYEDNDFGYRLNQVLKQNFNDHILTVHIDHDRQYQVDYTSWVYKGRDIWNKKKLKYNSNISSLIVNKNRVWGSEIGITSITDYYNTPRYLNLGAGI